MNSSIRGSSPNLHISSEIEDLSQFLKHAVNLSGIEPETVLKFTLSCANEGGYLIREALKSREASKKRSHLAKISDADLVTETDISVEKLVRNRILEKFPGHLFIGEEGTSDVPVTNDRAGKYVWIVDPIDGTTNFVHSFPVVAISIGFALGDETLMGVVYNPVTDETWFGWKNCGAYFRNRSGEISQIQTSGCTSLGSALVSTGFAVPLFRRKITNAEAQSKLQSIVEKNTRALMTKSRDIRRIGSAACDLCYVAMGRTDVFFEFGIKEWDVAAGLLILQEAGGEVSTVGGLQPCSIRGRNIMGCSSSELRREMASVLTDVDVVSIIEEIEQ